MPITLLPDELEAVKYGTDGLVPAVVQDADSLDVLMVAYMNDEALRRTLTSGATCFWSRSRQEYWVKGETSGNTQKVVDVRYDCDSDCVLVLVRQNGVACHTGERSCFHRSFGGGLGQDPSDPPSNVGS
ncbi:MAG: phosphoribosyl-AMP cyclohydrolase [Actinobacteria bacterium ATB1]|nr:phosphoribosyl-AMP cyclohydrolase [Actinobacteria bacterium ATB1]